MATLKLKYGRFPVKLTTIAQEISEHVSELREVRSKQCGPVARSKVCRDCKQTLPLNRDFFYFRKPRSDRPAYWWPVCRKCKRINRERVRKLRATS